MPVLLSALWVALGGALGALMRWGVSEAVARAADRVYVPWATLAVNIAGCGFLGYLAARSTQAEAGWLIANRPLLAVGFCGALTTFSTFGLETLTLLQRRPVLAVALVAAHLLLGIGAVAIGQKLGT